MDQNFQNFHNFGKSGHIIYTSVTGRIFWDCSEAVDVGVDAKNGDIEVGLSGGTCYHIWKMLQVMYVLFHLKDWGAKV